MTQQEMRLVTERKLDTSFLLLLDDVENSDIQESCRSVFLGMIQICENLRIITMEERSFLFKCMLQTRRLSKLERGGAICQKKN